MSKIINAVSFLAMLKEKCYYVRTFGENAELGIKYTDIEKLVNELPDTNEINQDDGTTNVSFSEDGKCLTEYSSEENLSYIVPDNVESIGPFAFSGIKKLEMIKFSNNVRIIHYHAFASCPNLRCVALPDNLQEIGFEAFNHCYNLDSVIYKGIKYQSKFVLEKVLKDNGVQVGYAIFDNTAMDIC